MRRLIILSGLVAAVGASAITALFLFGCCVLPFHHVLHRIAPLCSIATMLSAKPSGDPAEPAQPGEPQKPARRLAFELRASRAPISPDATIVSTIPVSPAAYRSFISLGAVRCDEDVGLGVLNEVFRI